MASSLQFLLFSSLLFLSLSYAQRSSRPNALVLPVSKDASTLQYLTKINQRTPLVPVTLVVDLGGRFLWVDCENNYVSSTYRTPGCNSDKCSISRFAAVCGGCFPSPRPAGSPCMRNRCILSADNSVTRTANDGELLEDVVSVQSTDGSNPGPAATVSKFLFSCAPTSLLKGLAGGATGMAGLGRSQISLPSQFASSFSFPRKFAVCLSSGTGVIFFGDAPYKLRPNIDPSDSLTYTPLFINPVSTSSGYLLGESSVEYFIGVTSIKITDKVVPLNTSLLSIDAEGYGGTKISTVNPYTVMESSIYKAFTEAFINEATARNITRAPSVAPFDVCFSTNNVGSTRLGPGVPFIELILQSQSVVWRITGSNSMVYVSDNVLCLGFVDGGLNPRTAIVIGGYQLEDNFLQFDLEGSRLGFSYSLLGRRTTCGNFNFTSSSIP
ncbi:unnamed protein product [Ilex paraguariensis]|uniref:Peptidase A1 domain-containing protein n=1 Tax=Ilex paraguariensis TaxID=185542 RepID=A0ABC8S6Z9_9AQUA